MNQPTQTVTQQDYPVDGPYSGNISCQVCHQLVSRYWVRNGSWPYIRGCEACMAGKSAETAPGGESAPASAIPALVTYEIYELVNLSVPNGTRQARRVIEWGRCTPAEMDLIRERTAKQFPQHHINASYPVRRVNPRWEGTLENWIGRMRG